MNDNRVLIDISEEEDRIQGSYAPTHNQIQQHSLSTSSSSSSLVSPAANDAAIKELFGIGPKRTKPPDGRGSSGFVGLKNQGATCYLNSLIQALYMTPELRSQLFAIDPSSLGATSAFLEHAPNVVSSSSSGSSSAMEIIELDEETNTANDCGTQTKMPAYEQRRMKKITRPRPIPLELQKLFTKMQTLDLKALTTER